MTKEYVKGLAGVPAKKTAISSIDGAKGILAYRGYDIADLVKNSSFEEVIYLLVYGELPTALELSKLKNKLINSRNVSRFGIKQIMKSLSKTTNSMTVLQICAAALGTEYEGGNFRGGDESADKYMLDIIPQFIGYTAAIVAIWEHIRKDETSVQSDDSIEGFAENLLFTLTGKKPNPVWVKLMDACLILHAEHSMNASTFTTVVCASSLPNPCSVLSSAIASLSGPLHGGANTRVLSMFKEIGTTQNVRPYIEKKLAAGEVIWGIGHREYKVKDPRATILQELTENLLQSNEEVKKSKLFDVSLEVEKVCYEKLSSKGLYPNVDFYSGILYSEMGLSEDLFTPLFAVARTAGWFSHWREQMLDNRIFRPSAVYVGKSNRKYKTLEKRK